MQNQNEFYRKENNKVMEKRLDFFLIDDKYYGGDQNWHSNWMMKRGGCSAVTACETCIYLARKNNKMQTLYPFDSSHVTKKNFLDFFETMYKYIYPGIRGLTSIGKFRRMLQNYTDTTAASVSITTLDGGCSYSEAKDFIKNAIDSDLPVMYLMLSHIKKEFDEYEWHWFTVTGYRELEDDFIITFATWGKEHTFSLPAAWETKRAERGGLVCMVPGE